MFYNQICWLKCKEKVGKLLFMFSFVQLFYLNKILPLRQVNLTKEVSFSMVKIAVVQVFEQNKVDIPIQLLSFKIKTCQI